MKKRHVFLIIILTFLFLLTAGYFFVRYLMSPLNSSIDQQARFEVSYGTSAKKIAHELQENKLIRNEHLFYAVVKYPFLLKVFYPSSEALLKTELKSGTYYLSPKMDYSVLIKNLTSGQQEYIHVSIPEGLTISKIGLILEENGICSKDDFKKSCSNAEILEKYQIPSESCEGFLFPDTYYLNSGMTADSIVKIMIDNFYEKTASIDAFKQMSLQDFYEAVTLASIVEREYRIPEEAPLIASVFKNRIKKNIGLYSCATVEYILTEIEGRPHPERILIEDTKIDNPYNTYKWAGLPPGPISNPGLVALNAVANTPKTNYYFFQIVNPAEGRHVFTTTFDEHVSSHNLYTK